MQEQQRDKQRCDVMRASDRRRWPHRSLPIAHTSARALTTCVWERVSRQVGAGALEWGWVMSERLLVSQTFSVRPVGCFHSRTAHITSSNRFKSTAAAHRLNRPFAPTGALPPTGMFQRGARVRFAHLCSRWFPCGRRSPGHSGRWRIPSCSHSSRSDRCLNSDHTHPHLDREGRVEQRKNFNF